MADMSGKSRTKKIEVRAKMMRTVNPIAGNSKLGMTVADALSLTEAELAKRKARQRAQKAARKRNRK